MTWVLGALLVAAAPVKIAAPGLTPAGVDAGKATFYTEHLAQQLNFTGVQVITAKEISSLIGMERQRQLLGCGSDSTSCLAELANALGTDAVLLGDVAKVEGAGFQLNLKIISATDGRPLAAFSASVATEAALLEKLGEAARSMSVELHRQLGRELPKQAGPSAGLRGKAWAPAAVGVVATLIGAVLLGMAGGNYAALTVDPSMHITPMKAGELRDSGNTYQLAGAVLLGVGIACVVAAAAMFLFGAPGS
jgi:hypothetical protein